MNTPHHPLSALLLCGLLLLIPNAPAQAGSATWNPNPTSGDWNTAANWIPATVPNGPADTVTFGVSNIRDVSLFAVIRTVMAFSGPEARTKVLPRTLSFAERVSYQRAIEDVYWRHRIWPKENSNPKPTLDAVMSQAQLERKV